MAFVCVRYLEYRISVQTKRLSPRAIREALMQVQASIIQDTQTGKTYLLPSSISPEAKEIYRVLGIKNGNNCANSKNVVPYLKIGTLKNRAFLSKALELGTEQRVYYFLKLTYFQKF